MVPNFYYQYQPLESPSHIRLLQITPAESQRQRRGSPRASFSLVHVSLDDAPPFESISYAWGNPGRFYKLPMSDDDDIAVTKSVYEALPYLIQRCETGFLWMDQICVNQDDKDERGHQVTFMGRIYTTAQRTIIWLGLADQHTAQVEELLARLADVSNLDEANISDLIDLLESMDASQGIPTCDKVLESIFRRPWFSRAWIVQELFLSSCFVAVVGKTELDLDNILTFALACLRMWAHVPQLIKNYFWITRGDFIIRSRDDFSETRSAGSFDQLDFLALFIRTIEFEFHATDLKYKIFAYLGLWKPASFEPNYKVATAEAYTNFSKAMVEDTGSLDILGFCSGVHNSSIADIPSWSIDWIINTMRRPLIFYINKRKKVLWRASKRRPHKRSPSGSNAISKTLNVRGKTVETVSTVSIAFEIDDPRLDNFWNAVARVGESIGTSKVDILKVIAGALSLGHKPDHPPEYYIDRYETLCGSQKNNEADLQRRRQHWTAEVVLYFITDISTFAGIMESRTVARTKSGRFSLCPVLTAPGDSVAVLHGSRVPIMLRKGDKPGTFRVVGDCYVEGIMFGEAVTLEEEDADQIILV